MAKHGVFNDYDLMANNEKSAQNQTCVVCGLSPMAFLWSDYHGEGMCIKCGCPYQLKGGTADQMKGGDYPYLNVITSGLPVLKEYWEEKKTFTYFGMSMSNQKSYNNFIEWAKEKHPEILVEKDNG
jgi:hypothetical protein